MHGKNYMALLANSLRGLNPRCELRAPASKFTSWIQSTVWITCPCQQIHTVDAIHGVNCKGVGSCPTLILPRAMKLYYWRSTLVWRS